MREGACPPTPGRRGWDGGVGVGGAVLPLPSYCTRGAAGVFRMSWLLPFQGFGLVVFLLPLVLEGS